MARQELIPLLYQALAEPIGLVLRTSDWRRARQQLYAARVQAADGALVGLQFRAWPGEDGDLVITKVRVEVLAGAKS